MTRLPPGRAGPGVPRLPAAGVAGARRSRLPLQLPAITPRASGMIAACRTTRPGASCTTPTPTSWRRRPGCATTPTRGLRDRIEPLQLSGRQRAAPDRRPRGEQLRDLDGRVRPARRAPPQSDEYRGRRGGRDHGPQELRRHRLVPRRRPAARARPARLLEPARVQHVPQPPAARLGARRRPSSWPIGAARAHNRGMVEFCSVDDRLLPTLLRAAGRLRPRRRRWPTRRSRWAPPPCSSRRAARPATRPATIGLDPVWAAAQEAGIPVVFHVGGTGDLIDPDYFRNGLPIPPDFHGGEENFRSVDYMGIPGPPAQTLATMIFDGVFERFPDLRIGVIEQGAIWVPSWMRQMESAFDAFARHEERLQRADAAPERVRAPPGPVHAVPDRGRRLDHRAGRPRGLPVLVGLPPRRGRPPPDRALRGVARRRRRRRSARPSTATTSST